MSKLQVHRLINDWCSFIPFQSKIILTQAWSLPCTCKQSWIAQNKVYRTLNSAFWVQSCALKVVGIYIQIWLQNMTWAALKAKWYIASTVPAHVSQVEPKCTLQHQECVPASFVLKSHHKRLFLVKFEETVESVTNMADILISLQKNKECWVIRAVCRLAEAINKTSQSLCMGWIICFYWGINMLQVRH